MLDSVGKLPLDKALDLSLYLSQETEIMPVLQGFSELVPLYKLMERRDTLEALENQMKVSLASYRSFKRDAFRILYVSFVHD